MLWITLGFFGAAFIAGGLLTGGIAYYLHRKEARRIESWWDAYTEDRVQIVERLAAQEREQICSAAALGFAECAVLVEDLQKANDDLQKDYGALASCCLSAADLHPGLYPAGTNASTAATKPKRVRKAPVLPRVKKA